MIGAPEWAQLKKGGWQSSFGFRYQFSDRHFVGDDEQEDREADNSQVKNTLYLFDFSLSYGLDERTSLSVSLPFQIADRSQLIRDLAPERNVTTARGIGDLVITARRWMRDNSEPRDWNYQLGFGLKFPTGQPNATDTFKFVNEDGEPDREQRTVDQSIQPGDGGFGFLIDLNTFRRFGDEFAGYLSGTYLFNPMETNGVDTYRGRDSESIMSIPDTYMARGGVQWVPAEKWAYGLGLRLEGVPSEDVFGGSEGFRRPGYAWSLEPSVSYAAGRSIFSVAMPWALYRNRTVSVPDEQDGRHGDAAFADWVFLFGWTFAL